MAKKPTLPGELKTAIDGNRHKRNLNLMSVALLLYVFTDADLDHKLTFFGGGIQLQTVLPVQIAFLAIFFVSWWRYWATVPPFWDLLLAEIADEIGVLKGFQSLAKEQVLTTKHHQAEFKNMRDRPTIDWRGWWRTGLTVHQSYVAQLPGQMAVNERVKFNLRARRSLPFICAGAARALVHQQVIFEVLVPHLLAIAATMVWLSDLFF